MPTAKKQVRILQFCVELKYFLNDFDEFFKAFVNHLGHTMAGQLAGFLSDELLLDLQDKFFSAEKHRSTFNRNQCLRACH
jgi:hypothetical protein